MIMPHVLISGPASIEQYFQEFEAFTLREGTRILKLKDAFLNHDKSIMMLEAVVVEDRIPQTFYIVIAKRGEFISVHLDMLTDPEKNDGVRRLLALVAYKLTSQHPDCRYAKHNLDGFLIETPAPS